MGTLTVDRRSSSSDYDNTANVRLRSSVHPFEIAEPSGDSFGNNASSRSRQSNVVEANPGSSPGQETENSTSAERKQPASFDSPSRGRMGETESLDVVERREAVNVSLLSDVRESDNVGELERSRWRGVAIRNQAAFFLFGLINNASYVIMMALAKDIMPAAVGLVFLTNVLPTMLVKLSAPYWFHLVPYSARVTMGSVVLVMCFSTVAYGTATWVQLFGVACSAVAGGLGEPSFLALTSLYDTPCVLSAWSSGSGAAGIFGYGWVFLLKFVLSSKAVLMMACILPAGWMFAYFILLGEPQRYTEKARRAFIVGEGMDPTPGIGRDDPYEGQSYHHPGIRFSDRDASRRVFTDELLNGSPSTSVVSGSDGSRGSAGGASLEAVVRSGNKIYTTLSSRQLPSSSPPAAGALRLRDMSSLTFDNGTGPPTNDDRPLADEGLESGATLTCINTHAAGESRDAGRAARMTARERLRFVLSLWKFMVPLMLVFFAEYTIQTGPWSAIGFPVTSAAARKRFYEFSNWAYWGGVFLSRSSGMILKLSASELWILPAVQMFMIFFFYYVAAEHVWYGDGLLFLCFGVGLIGGLAYVNAFRLVAEAVAPELKELALASASVGDSMGIVSSDIVGTFVQKALYRINDIHD